MTPVYFFGPKSPDLQGFSSLFNSRLARRKVQVLPDFGHSAASFDMGTPLRRSVYAQ